MKFISTISENALAQIVTEVHCTSRAQTNNPHYVLQLRNMFPEHNLIVSSEVASALWKMRDKAPEDIGTNLSRLYFVDEEKKLQPL